MKDKLGTCLCLVGLLAFLYFGAYFALARRGPTFQWSGHWVAWPRYVALPDTAEVCFRDLHKWDRSVLRPGFWAGTSPPEEWRQQQLLMMEVLLRDVQAAAEPK